MARSETVVSVFVASPSDVMEERKILESVVHEVNRTWSKNLNLRLELLKWETDVYPGFGSYPQDVINQQINDDYDVFISIFWGRIGSPTEVSVSGTVEEFERAYARHCINPGSVDMMMYFKDQGIPPSKIDSSQLTKINDLKQQISSQGALFWTFDDAAQFESLLRGHLSQVAQKWAAKLQVIGNDKVKIETVVENNQHTGTEVLLTDFDEYGLLDYLDIYSQRMSDMTTAIVSIAEATEKVGTQFTKRTEEINSIFPAQSVETGFAIKFIKLASDDLERYADIVEAQIRISGKSREEAFDALSKALAIYVDFEDAAETNDLNELLGSLIHMQGSAADSRGGIASFRDSILTLPRLTVQLNRSKKRAVKALDAVLEEFDVTMHSSGSVIKIINELNLQKTD